MKRFCWSVVLGIAVSGSIALAGCRNEPEPVTVEVTRVVSETVIETREVEVLTEVTRVVTEIQEVEAVIPGVVDPDPGMFVKLISEIPSTFDPGLSFEYLTDEILNNTMEPLITWNHTDPNSYVPVLATEVPSVENGLISADGLSYTLPIREGVTFHDGGALEPHDVAYSIQRGLLQSDPLDSRQFLYIMPIMGYESGDITEEIGEGAFWSDPEGLRANATPEELLATCDKVKAAVVADDDAGTVTINLASPSTPFMSALPYLFILDQEWAAAQGDWDG